MKKILLLSGLCLLTLSLAACPKDDLPVFDDDGNAITFWGRSTNSSDQPLQFAWTLAGAWSEFVPSGPTPSNGKAVPVAVTSGGGGQQLTASYQRSADLLSPSYELAPGPEIVGLFTGGRAQGVLATRIAALVFFDNRMETGLQMTVARVEHALTPIANQRVLIAGGYGPQIPTVVLNSAEVFDYSSRTFTATAGAMHFARGDHAMATLADGRVLVTGGLVPVGAGSVTIDAATTEIFNPATGTFSDGPNMSVARFNHSAVTLNDGRVLVLGGNRRKSAEVYTPGTNTFTPLPDMSVNHGDGHVAIKLPNGKVLVIGGDADVIQPTAVVEVFDPVLNTFSIVGNMSIARMLHMAVLLGDGRVLIAGGRGPDGSSLSSAEILNPANNSFTPTANMPGESYDSPGVFVRPPR